ncbi:MAG TPA: hypothetical protein VMF87_01995 [Streptosporangiaceae bacterium]|nr:hypothetical protein [Streptosporangiaceae bacterium]
MSTSSIRAPPGQGSSVVTPSSVTDSVAARPPPPGTATTSNGFSASDTNRSTCIRSRWAGGYSARTTPTAPPK